MVCTVPRRKCLLIALLGWSLASQVTFGSTFQFDNQRTGRVSARVVNDPRLLWAFDTGGSIEATPVLAADGTIYVASADGLLYALDRNGSVQWTFRGRESFFASPTVGPDGRVYCADLSGTYYALDPQSGEPDWMFEIQSEGDRRVLTSPLISSAGHSVIGAWDNWVYAIDADGELKWRFRLDGLPSASAAGDDAGNVYVAGQSVLNHNLLAVYQLSAENGAVRWMFTEDLWMDRTRVTSAPTLDLDRGRLYLGVSRSEDGLLLALDLASGKPAFQTTLSRGILGSPAIGVDGTIYVGCLDGRLYALSPGNGQILWNYRAAGDYVTSSPVVDGAGRIFFGDSDGVVHAVEPNGTSGWRFSTGSNISSAPAIDSEGRIYVTSFDGRVYALGSPEILYFPHMGDGLWDEFGIVTRLELVNRGLDTEVQVSLLGTNGHPLPAALNEPGDENGLRIDLPRGMSKTVETPGTLPLRGGYVKVSSGPGVSGNVVIRFAQGGVVICEAGVPATRGLRDFTIFLDTAGAGRKTGLAFVNISAVPTAVTLRLYDKNFQHLSTEILSGLQPGTQYAGYANDLFPDVDFHLLQEGLLTVESEQLVAPVTLQQVYDASQPFPQKVPTLTTFPVLAGRADGDVHSNPGSTLYFPQVGQGWHGSLGIHTAIALANTGGDTSARLEIFDSQGEPLTFFWASLGSGSRFDLEMPSGSAVRARTVGDGPPEVGYAKVTAAGEVGGTVVFTGLEENTILYEAGVPGASALSDFSVMVKWKASERNTGLAVVNPGNEPAHLTFRLYDSLFHPVGELTAGEILGGGLEPGHHFAMYVTQIFPAILREDDWTGIMTVESDQPVAAVTLSEGDDPHLTLPEDVYRLTVYPVVPGRPER